MFAAHPIVMSVGFSPNLRRKLRAKYQLEEGAGGMHHTALSDALIRFVFHRRTHARTYALHHPLYTLHHPLVVP